MDRNLKITALAVFLLALGLGAATLGRTGITGRELAVTGQNSGVLSGQKAAAELSRTAGVFYRFMEPAGRLVTVRPYSYRAGAALCFSLTVLTVFLWTARALGILGGLAASLLLLFLPRAFAAGVQATEFPLVAVSGVASAWLADRRNDRAEYVLAFLMMGLGLALSPKFLLPVFCITVWLTLSGRLQDRAWLLASGFAGMLIIPVLLNSAWWSSPFASYRSWLAGELAFAGYGSQVLYFGEAFRASVPWHYVIVMLVVGMPVSVVTLSITGKLVSVIPRYFSGPAGFAVTTSTSYILYATSGRFPADYGLAFFLPLFAADSIMSAYTLEWFRQRFWARGVRIPAWVLLMFVVLPQIAVGARLYPFLGCHYNPIAGYLPGAQRAGFQVSFDSSPLTDDFLTRVESQLPPKAKLQAIGANRAVVTAGGRLAGHYAQGTEPNYLLVLNSSTGQVRPGKLLLAVERAGVMLAGFYELP